MPFNSKPYTLISHLDNVTASRAFFDEYTNTKGRTLYVMICVACVSTGGAGKCSAAFFVDSNIANRWMVGQPAAAVGHAASYEIMAVIKPGQKYSLWPDTPGGTVTIDRWWEGY